MKAKRKTGKKVQLTKAGTPRKRAAPEHRDPRSTYAIDANGMPHRFLTVKRFNEVALAEGLKRVDSLQALSAKTVKGNMFDRRSEAQGSAARTVLASAAPIVVESRTEASSGINVGVLAAAIVSALHAVGGLSQGAHGGLPSLHIPLQGGAPQPNAH